MSTQPITSPLGVSTYERCRFCGFKTATYKVEGRDGTYCSICCQIPAPNLVGATNQHDHEDVETLASVCWIANRLLHEIKKIGRNGA